VESLLSWSQSRSAARRIREHREQAGITGIVLAGRAGLRAERVTDMERATVRLRAGDVAAVAAALGVTVDELTAETPGGDPVMAALTASMAAAFAFWVCAGGPLWTLLARDAKTPGARDASAAAAVLLYPVLLAAVVIVKAAHHG
jgi:transcriptional regulator with XRE-family HTH domain